MNKSLKYLIFSIFKESILWNLSRRAFIKTIVNKTFGTISRYFVVSSWEILSVVGHYEKNVCDGNALFRE